jgi:excisionase family DNA binding protein
MQYYRPGNLYLSSAEVTMMEKGFFTVEEVSEYLSVKVSTVYAKVSEMPHYKVGNLLRFKKEEIDAWMVTKKRPPSEEFPVIRRKSRSHGNIKTHERSGGVSLVRKAIDEVNGKGYNFTGKSDPTKDLGKEVRNGIV